MTRVLIADDHALFRAGLRQFLVEALPSAEIGEAATGNEALTCLQRKGGTCWSSTSTCPTAPVSTSCGT